MSFSALLPVLTFVLIFYCLNSVNIRPAESFCKRENFLLAAGIWGVLIVMIVEFLSLLKLLNYRYLCAVWVLILFTAVMLLFKRKLFAHTPYLGKDFTALGKLSLLPVWIILGLTLITALVAPPNNYDSLSYHLSRVVHWISRESVMHYPTTDVRQLFLPPWSEFAVLNFILLGKHDFLANSVQWFAFVLCISGVSLIVKELGGDMRTQICAAIITACLPMAVLEASSTQNDLVMSAWITVSVYFSMRFLKHTTFIYATALGAGIGLAVLTKPVSYLILFPFAITLSVISFRKGILKILPYGVVAGLVALLINSGHYLRNYTVFGSPLPSLIPVSNETFNPLLFTGTVIKNLALHLQTPWQVWNEMVYMIVDKYHQLLGLNLNDARVTLIGGGLFEVPETLLHEDHGTNTLHFLLILLCLMITIVTRTRRNKPVLIYAGCVFSGFMLFCFFLKWQIWGARLHMPMFVLCGPLIAISVSKFSPRIRGAVLTVLFLCAIPYAVLNQSRPLLGHQSIFLKSRTEMYFTNYEYMYPSFVATAEVIREKGFDHVGLWAKKGIFEYPMWMLLNRDNFGGVTISHLEVTNASKKTEQIPGKPQAVLVARLADIYEPSIFIKYRNEYGPIKILGYWFLFF